MVSLETSYIGIKLKNPIIAGASSLTGGIDSIKRIEEAGAAAIVIKSLFQEEIQLSKWKFDEYNNRYNDLHAEMTSHYPTLIHSGAKTHIYWVKKAKEAVGIPVIASINAVDDDVWVEYAKSLEETGVDGLELNFYSLPTVAGGASEKLEAKQLEILAKVKAAVSIPVGVKLSPNYTNILTFIDMLKQQGAAGVVLFNRLFQPDIDITEEVEKTSFDLSSSADNRLSLRWTALLGDVVKLDICSNTGIMNGEDVIKMLLAGASAVQVVSTLYKNDIEYISTIIRDVVDWMGDKGYNSIKDFKGKLSKSRSNDPWAYERVHYIRQLLSKEETV